MKKIIRDIIASVLMAMLGLTAFPEANVAYAPDVKNVQEVVQSTETVEEIEITPVEKETEAAPAETIPVEENEAENGADLPQTVTSEEASMHAHSYQYAYTVTPACSVDGYDLYECECGDSYQDNFIGHHGHEFTLENAIVVAPTAKSEGYTEYHCSYCEAISLTNYVDFMDTVTFYDVNETVWANAAVNVRQGPDTGYDIVGGLEWAETVTRVGITDNGWSKVIYNGTEAYISSNYLQTYKPEPPFNGSTPSEEVAQKLRNSGATGILYIPSMGMEPVNVYLYRGTAVKSLQGIADARNSAYMVGVYMPNDSSNHHIEFGDHVNHNFSVLKNIPVGTMAYFNMGDKVVRFKCVETISHCSMSQYFAGCYAEGGMIKTTCCSGNGRTVNRWVVTADSDLTFEEFYALAGQGERVYWNT